MNIAPYESLRLLDQFHRDMRQFFGSSQQPDRDSTIATSTWVPLVDIKEETQHFLIEADIPGVEPKNIEISMENGVLTIKGERQLESQEVGDHYKRVERLYGTFYRRFSLPDTADAEKISASGQNGVLRVTIPKKEVAQPRRIAVQS